MPLQPPVAYLWWVAGEAACLRTAKQRVTAFASNPPKFFLLGWQFGAGLFIVQLCKPKKISLRWAFTSAGSRVARTA